MRRVSKDERDINIFLEKQKQIELLKENNYFEKKRDKQALTFTAGLNIDTDMDKDEKKHQSKMFEDNL